MSGNPKHLTVELSTDGIKELKKSIKDYQKWLKQKSDDLCKRLAEMGATQANLYFGTAIYDGVYDFEVHYEPTEGGYIVKASGEKILFIEFGSGLIGYGHPEPHGMQPGTYSDTIGKGHWADPDGWYYEHGKKSRGNPPNMPMYNTVKYLEQELERVVKEVFA